MIGKTISHYHIIEELGRGGMGVVYKAEDSRLKRSVALKFLPPELTRNAKSKARFIQEAQTASSLDHPNICNIHEIDETQDGQLFIVMACYEGETLRERLDRGPLTLGEVVDITYQVMEGLTRAHAQGIVHRDIKPGNIFITKDGQVKIVDFGLSKLAGQTRITRDGSTAGTAAYMSPEQVRGKKIDDRTDIWSLGVVIYEMVTGQLPFIGEYEQAILYAICNEKPEPLTHMDHKVPWTLGHMVKKALAKQPDHRYPDIVNMLDDLEKVKDEMPSEERRKLRSSSISTRIRNRFTRLSRRKFIIPIAVLLLILLLYLIPPTRKLINSGLGISTSSKGLVIYPFTMMGGDSTEQAFCTGLVEMLTERFSMLEEFQRSVWVFPSLSIHESDVFSHKDVRNALGADLLMIGQMQSLGGVMRLEIDLLDAKSLQPVTSSLSFSDPVTNLATWQNDIVQKLAGALDLPFDEEMTNANSFGSTMIPDAFSRYIEGLSFRYEEQEDKVNSAISLFTEALEYDPRFIMAYIALGDAFFKKYNVLKDEKWIARADSVYYHAVTLSDSSAFILTKLGTLYLNTGRYDKAIECLMKAIEMEPSNYSAHLELATAYEYNSNLEIAEKYYNKLIRLRSGYVVGYSCLGVFFLKYGGRYDEAAKMFEHHVKLSPNDTYAYNNLGGVYYYLGDYEKAEETWQKSINIKPNSDAYSNLGTIYFYENNYAKAEAMFSEAVEQFPDYCIFWGNLGDAYRYLPEYKHKAQEMYKTALSLVLDELIINPQDAELLSLASLYRIRIGDKKRALIDISRALELTPDYLRVLRKGIFVYELAGNREQAVMNFEKYYKLGGSLEDIQHDPDMAALLSDTRIQVLINQE